MICWAESYHLLRSDNYEQENPKETTHILTGTELEQMQREAWDASQAATMRPVGPCHTTDNFTQYITFEDWQKGRKG